MMCQKIGIFKMKPKIVVKLVLLGTIPPVHSQNFPKILESAVELSVLHHFANFHFVAFLGHFDSIKKAQIEIQCKRRNAPFSYRHAASR